MRLDVLFEAVKSTLSIPESVIEFLDKRLTGARKIYNQTLKKGGYALLTAIHFKAKFTPYKDAIKFASKKDGEKHLKKKADEAFNKLKSWDKLSQREFQHLTGVLEAYGEAYIRIVKPDSIKFK